MAHCNTILSQILKLVPRHEFERLANQHHSLLNGVRIIDLTTIVLGPMATQVMADLGAEVIKVESLEGDLACSSGVTGPDGMGAVFANNNRNKKVSRSI